MKTQITADDGTVTEWWGVDDNGTDWVHWKDGAEIERRPATPEELTVDSAWHEAAVVLPPVLTQAQQGIEGIFSQAANLQAQLQADIAAVTAGWNLLTDTERTQIILRMLNAFGMVMSGLTDHATLTGAIIPPTPPTPPASP